MSDLTQLIFILLVVFQLKHILCDYVLQFPFMYRGKGLDRRYLKPLLTHTLIHGNATFLISLYFTNNLYISLSLGCIDLIIHTMVDRLKASPKYLNRWGPEKKLHWVMLSIDQSLHHMTHYLIIFLTISYIGTTHGF